ncbi:MAG: hypothetical protein N2170_02785 [Bacteroidia bacterium]|nr:hypothetical protein [Bacteroidia bacterium]
MLPPLEPPLPPHGYLLRRREDIPASFPSWILIDPVEIQSGELLVEVEVLLWEIRRKAPNSLIGFHLTYWPIGFAYGEDWGLDFLLYHSGIAAELQLPISASHILPALHGWCPPPPWKLLSSDYRPSLELVESLNAFLSSLQRLRKSMPTIWNRSSLVRTVTSEGQYIHPSQKHIDHYVATVRR